MTIFWGLVYIYINFKFDFFWDLNRRIYQKKKNQILCSFSYHVLYALSIQKLIKKKEHTEKKEVEKDWWLVVHPRLQVFSRGERGDFSSPPH